MIERFVKGDRVSAFVPNCKPKHNLIISGKSKKNRDCYNVVITSKSGNKYFNCYYEGFLEKEDEIRNIELGFLDEGSITIIGRDLTLKWEGNKVIVWSKKELECEKE